MNEELLRTRAERGQARGAAAVWADANRQLADTPPEQTDVGSLTPFRLAIAAAALVLLGTAAALLAQTSGGNRVVPADTPETGEPNAEEANPDDPAPILVDGMTLHSVEAQVDIRPNCGGPSGYETGRIRSYDCGERSYAVYANPAQPFADTIVVIDLLPDDDFALLGFNLDEAQVATFTDAVVQAEVDGDDTWILDPSLGLEEMARFDDSPGVQIAAGWIFDHRGDGSDGVTVQSELDVDEAGVWRWIARQAVEPQRGLQVARPVDVLGLTGVQVDGIGENDASFVWADDRHIYRMWAFNEPRFGGFETISPEPFLDRLRIADQSEWSAAVEDASETTAGEWIARNFDVLGVILLALVSAYFALRRRWIVAGLAIVGPLVWFWLFIGAEQAYVLLALGAAALALWNPGKNKRKTPPKSRGVA